MICATGKTPTELWAEMAEKFGTYELVEDNLRFSPDDKSRINDLLMVKKEIPAFDKTVTRVNYEDGCKIYFEDDSFVICRFSGTEPLLRIFAESSNAEDARKLIKTVKEFINI